MNPIVDEIRRMEAGLAGIGLKPSRLCADAGISMDAWIKWRKGTMPNTATWAKATAAFAKLIEDKE